MSEPFQIRLARDDELADVGALTLDGYVHDGFLTHDAPYADSLRDGAARAESAELYVAALDGALVGTVTFCPPGSDMREVSADGEGEFRMLAVSPAARGRGVGRALIERCFDRCRELGLGEMVICSMSRMRNAHRLYDALGFTRDPSIDWSPVPGVLLLGFRRVV